MADSGPRASVVEVPGCGHAPSLTQADQIKSAVDFLDDGNETA
jgi:pimeloyl-ACP methyl ester carboxylesterase